MASHFFFNEFTDIFHLPIDLEKLIYSRNTNCSLDCSTGEDMTGGGAGSMRRRAEKRRFLDAH